MAESKAHRQFASNMIILLLVVFGGSVVKATMLDLSYKMNVHSAKWPGYQVNFTIEAELKFFSEDINSWVEANVVRYNEHTGTHIDAPIHTWETGKHVDEIPIEDLIGPGIVLNVTQQSLQDPGYMITVQDLIDFEAEHGRMPNGSIVLMNSDRYRYYWDDRPAYFGCEDITNTSCFNHPGFSPESIHWLIDNRDIKGIGTDCYNFDSTFWARQHKIPAHHALLGSGRWGIENGANFHKLPPTGTTIHVMPIAIEKGSGGPARIVAFWDTEPPKCTSSGFLVKISWVVMVVYIITISELLN